MTLWWRTPVAQHRGDCARLRRPYCEPSPETIGRPYWDPRQLVGFTERSTTTLTQCRPNWSAPANANGPPMKAKCTPPCSDSRPWFPAADPVNIFRPRRFHRSRHRHPTYGRINADHDEKSGPLQSLIRIGPTSRTAGPRGEDSYSAELHLPGNRTRKLLNGHGPKSHTPSSSRRWTMLSRHLESLSSTAARPLGSAT